MQTNDELKILIWSIGDFPPPRFSLSTATQALNTGQLSLIRSVDIRDGVQTMTDEMTFINRQWQRYVRTKQDVEYDVVTSAGFIFTGPPEDRILSNEFINPARAEIKTPEEICGAMDVVAVISNVEGVQQIYIGYLSEVQAKLDAYLELLLSRSKSSTK